MTVCEKKQHRSVFFHAGQNAFLIGVPRESNPYKELPYRDLWEKGWRKAKEMYRTVNRFYADCKLAALLGTPPPTRPALKPSYQRGPRPQADMRTRPAQRPRPTLQQKFNRSRSQGAFTVGK